MPSVEGVSVNTIIMTFCDVEKQIKLVWPQSGCREYKREGNVLKMCCYNSKQLSGGWNTASRVLNPPQTVCVLAPKESFCLDCIILIKVTVVVQRVWMRDASISDRLSSVRLFVTPPARQHQAQRLSTGLDAAMATTHTRRMEKTPKIDGQLETERRRLERVICENSSDMQSEFGLHSPRASKSGKNSSSLSAFWSLSVGQESSPGEQERCAADRRGDKWLLQKSIDFYVVLVSWKLSRGAHKWPLIQPRRL